MVFRFIAAILATYRLAQLVVFDDGPLFVFARLREWSDRQAKKNQTKREKVCRESLKMNQKDFDIWVLRGLPSSLSNGLHCPYCIGVWAAGLCAILITFPTKLGDIFLTCLAIAGGQTILERNGK